MGGIQIVKVEITKEGELLVSSETGLEYWALQKWQEEFNSGEVTLRIGEAILNRKSEDSENEVELDLTETDLLEEDCWGAALEAFEEGGE